MPRRSRKKVDAYEEDAKKTTFLIKNIFARHKEAIGEIEIKGYKFKIAFKEDCRELHCVIPGPENTPYEGGKYQLMFRFPMGYPFKAPEITFGTRIYHCNVDYYGNICLNILKTDYGPTMNFCCLMNAVVDLMENPNPADPLNPNAATLYSNNKEMHDHLASLTNLRFAIPKEEITKASLKKLKELTSSKIHKRYVLDKFRKKVIVDSLRKEINKMTVDELKAKFKNPKIAKRIPSLDSSKSTRQFYLDLIEDEEKRKALEEYVLEAEEKVRKHHAGEPYESDDDSLEDKQVEEEEEVEPAPVEKKVKKKKPVPPKPSPPKKKKKASKPAPPKKKATKKKKPAPSKKKKAAKKKPTPPKKKKKVPEEVVGKRRSKRIATQAKKAQKKTTTGKTKK